MGCTKHCMTSWEKEGIVSLYSVWASLEHCMQSWAPQFEKVECIQRRAKKLRKGLEG